MRIAILVCSDDASDHADHYPNDGEKYVALLGPLRPDWTFHAVPVHRDVLPGLVSDHDAYIVSGSSHSNTSGQPWVDRLHAFLRRVDEARVPVIGICFGHQALAQALGGEVEPLPGDTAAEQTHVGVATLAMTTTEGEREPWMEPWRDTLTLYCAHEEQVTRLPERARILATHARCPVAMFAVEDHVVACEFHPELYEDYLVGKLRAMKGELGEDVAARIEGEARAAETHGPLLGRWLANFLDAAHAARSERQAA